MFFHRLYERHHHPHHHAMRRHAHHPFGGFFGGRGFGDEASSGLFGRGRKLGAADLQLLLLALLESQPSHGYELIKALEDRSGGFYAPSPGMVYPALTFLEEIGRTSVEAEGTKKRYSITDAGRDFLAQNRAAADALLTQLEWIGKRFAGVREAMAGAPDGSIAELQQAHSDLRAAIRAAVGASADEQRRIADVLQRAAAEIRKR